MTNITKNEKLNLWIQATAESCLPDMLVLIEGDDEQTEALGAEQDGSVLYIVPYRKGESLGVALTGSASEVLAIVDGAEVGIDPLKAIEADGNFVKGYTE
ncbi:MAG: hypothetical protein IKK83_04780 [Clostridia bacterium]|nr:hypothetical protein [Clostridia bacterium]